MIGLLRKAGMQGFAGRTPKLAYLVKLIGVTVLCDWCVFVQLGCDEKRVTSETRALSSKRTRAKQRYMIYAERKYGYMDCRGEVVIPAKYDLALPFSDSLALVKQEGRGFYIDRNGEMVLQCGRPWSYYSFHEGMAVVSWRDRFGLIDEQGRVVVRPKYVDILPVTEGMAAVCVSGERFFSGIVSNGCWGFLDTEGQMRIPARYRDSPGGFSGGLAVVTDPSDDGVGYIDKEGSWTIAPRFGSASSFSNGLARVGKGGKSGYIDKRGELVIPYRFATAGAFHEKRAMVVVGNKWGYIDRSGRVVVAAKYDHVLDFSEGLAAVNNGGRIKRGLILGGKWRFIDKQGRTRLRVPAEDVFRIPPYSTHEDDSLMFRGGLAKVNILSEPGHVKRGYIDRSGEWVWGPEPWGTPGAREEQEAEASPKDKEPCQRGDEPRR